MLPSDPYAQRVKAQALDTFFGAGERLFSTVVIPICITWAFWGWVDQAVLIGWFLLTLAVAAAMELLCWAYRKTPAASNNYPLWGRRLSWVFLSQGLYTGAAGMLFFFVDSFALRIFLLFWIVGLSVAAVGQLAYWLEGYFAFTIPALGMTAIRLLLDENTEYKVMAGLLLVALPSVIGFGRHAEKAVFKSIRQGFENLDLVEQLRLEKSKAEAANRDKTRFLAAASHDLRQPLHAIALFGAVLEKDLQGQPQHTNAKRLMRAVNALGTSLDTMLDVSRLDAGVIEPQLEAVALNQAFQSLNQVFASFADEKGLQLRLRASPLWVRSDPHLLQRLLANLVENAVKYTTQGGVLVVARPRGPSVWVDVIDTGAGIAPEHCESIFQEFYQIDNPGRDRTRGLGIGLSIVRRLSALLNHPVELHSLPGRGSRFRVKLPAAGAPRPALADIRDAHIDAWPTAQPGLALPLPRRVLLVDDEADIGDAVTALLSAHGVQVATARDETQAIAALNKATSQNTRFDALLCDYRLAGGADGLDLALRLRQRFAPGMPLLLVTGETSPERLQNVRDAKIPVLFKPVSAESLLAALASLR